MFSLPSQRDRKLALEALEKVGGGHFAYRLYGSSSGGERQLVLLARALATGAEEQYVTERSGQPGTLPRRRRMTCRLSHSQSCGSSSRARLRFR